MKSSTYNNFFHFDGKNICYNLINDKFVILEDDVKELFLAAERQTEMDELDKIHPEFFKYMVDEGFIIENETDEFSQVVEISKKADNNENQFLLFINPTMNCNFKCWYCYESHIKDSKMDTVTIDKTIQLIDQITKGSEGMEQFAISWFGGEPLLYFDKVIVPILTQAKQILDSRNIQLMTGFTTNGLLFDKKKIDFLKSFYVQEIQITLDGYGENHDQVRFISSTKGSFHQIVYNIILLAKNNFNVVIRINCSDKNMDDIDRIMELFGEYDDKIRKRLRFSYHKVWQLEDALENDVREYIDKYKSSGFYVDGAVYDSVRGSCYADKKNQAFLNYNGDVFKCSARDFKVGNRLGELNQNGVIEWNPDATVRENAKFKNKPCHTCSILPICGGGCSQAAYENLGKDYCVNDFDPVKKMEIVKRVFEQKILINA